MTVTATAKRRRKQARNGYRHLPPRLRPNYKVPDAATARRRMMESEQKRRAMQARGKKK